MIPKIIHYCWFGRNPLPELALKCIESWKKHLPNYEIKEWNEDNFDVNIIPYTAEAYKMKKYAFVSDYARFWILYKYGGIYFDTDVEVIKPIDDIIEKGAFMGCENDALPIAVAPGLGLGVPVGFNLLEKMLAYYENLHFEFKPNLHSQQTIVHTTTEMLKKHGLKDKAGMQYIENIWIYPSDYFCPINLTTNRLHVTENTRSIHHYAATWTDKKISIKKILKKLLPEWILLKISNLKRIIKDAS